jgi:hypothetical protein
MYSGTVTIHDLPNRRIDAVAYYRTSSKRQDIESQQSAVRQWCARNNVRLVGEFTDEGGKGPDVMKRLAFCRMLTGLRFEQIPAVLVVWHADRLDRFEVAESLVMAGILGHVSLLDISRPEQSRATLRALRQTRRDLCGWDLQGLLLKQDKPRRSKAGSSAEVEQIEEPHVHRS